jgi:hypothetical protein
MFNFIDLDDEVSVALSRARLANATAAQLMIASRTFSPKEARRQTIADGLFSIPLPEDPPEDEFPALPDPNAPANKSVGLLGKPVAPSQGGQGEIKSQAEVFESLVQMAYEKDDRFKNAYEEVKKSWPTLTEEDKQVRSDQLQEILNEFELTPAFLGGEYEDQKME